MFVYRCLVRSAWLDVNGHMNARAYFEVFSDAGDLTIRDLGLGPAYLDLGYSIFTGDFHLTYIREVLGGRCLTVTTRIVDLDAKRFIIHQEMIDDATGMLCATAEQLLLNVGVKSRRAEPFASEILEQLKDHSHEPELDAPRNVGRSATLSSGRPAG